MRPHRHALTGSRFEGNGSAMPVIESSFNRYELTITSAKALEHRFEYLIQHHRRKFFDLHDGASVGSAFAPYCLNCPRPTGSSP